jgi:cysteinyl-tRNA synthetase
MTDDSIVSSIVLLPSNTHQYQFYLIHGLGVNVVSIWKLDDPEVLRKERLVKEEMKRAKDLAKEEAARKLKEKEERSKISPHEMFLNQTDQFSKFDETGLPTHDHRGEPLSKGQIKKLQKEFAKQKELYEKYLSTQELK